MHLSVFHIKKKKKKKKERKKKKRNVNRWGKLYSIEFIRSLLGSIWCHKFAVWIIGFIRKPIKLPWSDNYPLANHIARCKGSANREVSLFSHLNPSFGYLRKIFPPRGLKYSLLVLHLHTCAQHSLLWTESNQNKFAFPRSKTFSTQCLGIRTQYHPHESQACPVQHCPATRPWLCITMAINF